MRKARTGKTVVRSIGRLIAGALLVCAPASSFAQSATVLLNEAQRLYTAEQFDRAGELFREAIESAREARNANDEAEARAGLGYVLYQRAKYPEARAEMEQALATFEAAGARASIARVARGLGSVQQSVGDPSGAARWYQRALSIAEEDGLEEEQARTLGSFAFVPGPQDDRQAMIARALALSRKLGLRPLEATLLHQQGDHLFITGRFAEAQEALDAAVVILSDLGRRRDLARTLTSLGRVYRAHGQLDRALDCYRRSLALQEEIGEREGAIQSMNAIAVTLEGLGQPKEAHEIYKRALSLAEQTGSPRIILFMQGALASSYLALGDYARARDLLEAVVAQPMEPYVASYRYVGLASVYLGLKDFPRAIDAADKAVTAIRQSGQTERLPDVLHQRAIAHKEAGQLREALADTNELLASVEQLRAKLAPSDFMKRGFGDWWTSAFALAVDLHHALGEPERAIEVAEAARARAFVDLLATRNVQGKPSDRERLAELHRVDDELKAVGVDPAAPPPSAQVNFRGGDRNASTSALVKRWRTADPELRSFVAAEPPSVRDIVATARRIHSTIVTYWVGQTTTFIGVVRPDGAVRTRSVAVTDSRLNALARATQPDVKDSRGAATVAGDLVPRVRGGDLTALAGGGREARRELYRLLIAPIADLLPGDDGAMLTIVPHGPLFLVSFAALLDDHGKYLLERYTIHYAPSSAVLQYTSGKQQTPGTPRYLLVGDPADLPAADGGKPLPRLPGSQREVAAVARSLRGRDVTLLTGSDAHEAQVRDMLGGKTVLHFATHGIVRDDDPFESFLALGRSGDGSSADGRLTAQEIYDLDLHADLVILSACRTAAGRVTGDGIIGLTRAFLYAGTPSVVATLWDVADEPGLYLLPALYASLDAGQTHARALRSAQLKLLAQLRAGRVQIDGPIGRVTLPEDPLFWAGFVLVGEP